MAKEIIHKWIGTDNQAQRVFRAEFSYSDSGRPRRVKVSEALKITLWDTTTNTKLSEVIVTTGKRFVRANHCQMNSLTWYDSERQAVEALMADVQFEIDQVEVRRNGLNSRINQLGNEHDSLIKLIEKYNQDRSDSDPRIGVG